MPGPSAGVILPATNAVERHKNLGQHGFPVMVRTRILFGTLMILATVAILWLDARCAAAWYGTDSSALGQRMLNRGGPSTLLVCLLAMTAAFEFNKLLAVKGLRPMSKWTVSMAGALVLAPWLAGLLADDLGAAALLDFRITMAVLIVALLGVALGLIVRRDPARGLADFGGAALVIVYVGLFMSFAARLRLSLPDASGAWLVLLWAAVVKFTDVGAFFVGLAVGRTPLIPAISPKKTVEGFLGGLFAGVLVGVLGWFLAPSVQPVFAAGPGPPILYLIVFAVVMSLLGQGGDLLESLIKRSAEAKDSASLIPTFGGILDLVDSLLLTAPVAWLMLSRWNPGG